MNLLADKPAGEGVDIDGIDTLADDDNVLQTTEMLLEDLEMGNSRTAGLSPSRWSDADEEVP